MFWFATYKTDAGTQVKHFYTVEAYFEWLQEYVNENGKYPHQLCVYTGKCVFDGG